MKSFHEDGGRARREAELFLEKWYGERCQDLDKNCIVCKLYAALDELFVDVNQYGDPSDAR